MKNCSWYLWLNGRKIFNIRELRENFDTAVLSGYFLGGSLMKWLSDLGEHSIMKRLSAIDMNGDIGMQLEFAFGVSPDKKTEHGTEIRPENPPRELPVSASELGFDEAAVFCGAASSFSAFSEAVSVPATASSFHSFAETASSFGMNSSYAAFVSGQAINIIQSSGGSFRSLFETAGSFSFGALSGGSFSHYLSSYKGFYAGSYLLSSLSGSLFAFSSGMYALLAGSIGEGSFVCMANGITVTAEEYRRTLINLSSCPLNAYGYGINLV